jgi:hypothetical protein
MAIFLIKSLEIFRIFLGCFGLQGWQLVAPTKNFVAQSLIKIQ